MNSITWKGVSSTDIEGLLICELPPITKPQMRTKETIIDGRDGSIIEELGYEPYDKAVVIGLHGNYDIDKVMKYFTGDGEVVFSNEPDKVYIAKISGKIDYTRLLRFRQATITFRVQPYKFKKDEDATATQTETASGTNLVLQDSGNTPVRITTEADEIVIHGKNIVNGEGLLNWTNTSLEVKDDGYTIAVKGSVAYAKAIQKLPLSLRGKTYCLQCDTLTSEQKVQANAQINISAPSGDLYIGINQTTKQREVIIPSDATKIELVIVPNNTSTPIDTENTVTVQGLRLTPYEFANDDWHKYQGIQTISVNDGVVICTGYEPVTVVSNADNIEMSVEYFKPFEVINEGLEESKPIMSLRGSGTVEMLVNGVHTFTYTFPEGDTEVVIDSEKEDAYMGGFLKNRNMNGEFPILQAGANKIEWNGNVESITIQPKSRWL